jgi:transcriptional regulator with XRE-family HTH domain
MSEGGDNAQEQALLGLALAALRERSGMTQLEAAEAARPKMTSQNWGLYEAGQAKGILTPDVQTRLAAALGAERTDLLEQRQRVERFGPPRSRTRVARRAGLGAGEGVGEASARFGLLIPFRSRAPADPERTLNLLDRYGPTTAAMQLADDSLYPWGASGMTVVYDTAVWPRKDQGCVVVDARGEWSVKIYVSSDDRTVTVRELHPEPRELVLQRDPQAEDGIRALYAVVGRLD